jgi:prepilin-type N-terminal cleavage/methylation domain-containing protein
MTHLRPDRASQRGDDGLSLVEMLVALLILAVAMGAMAGGLIAALSGDAKNDRRGTATQLAADRLEQLRRLPFAQVRPELPAASVPLPVMADGSATATPTMKGTTYTIATTREWCADQWNGTGGAADLDYVRFVVTVSWQVKGQAQAVTAGNYRAPVRGDRPEDEFVAGTTIQGSGSC